MVSYTILDYSKAHIVFIRYNKLIAICIYRFSVIREIQISDDATPSHFYSYSMTPGSTGRLTTYEIIIWRCTPIHGMWFFFLLDNFMWRQFLGQNWIRSLSVPAAFLLLYLLACRCKHINGAWENSQLETWHHTVCYWVTLVFSLYQQCGQFRKSQTSHKLRKDLFGS